MRAEVGPSRRAKEEEEHLVTPSDLPLQCRFLGQGGDTLAVTFRTAAAHQHPLASITSPLPDSSPPVHTHTHLYTPRHSRRHSHTLTHPHIHRHRLRHIACIWTHTEALEQTVCPPRHKDTHRDTHSHPPPHAQTLAHTHLSVNLGSVEK